ncbi:hypothetical protein KY345_00655, partial [Candidatus Woesearchaeota archaeon]|nr:hypothetical protein [Candidatus Woesearchaeota archaeon]
PDELRQIRMQTLEKKATTALNEEQRRFLSERFGQKVDGSMNINNLNSGLHDILYLLIRSSSSNRAKDKDYDLALAICTHWQYPVGIFDNNSGFMEYCRSKRYSPEKAEARMRRYLRI